MRSRKNSSHGGNMPPFIDPAFAEALAGNRRDSSHRHKPDYKALQLCRQVQRALNLSLSGECGDALLNALYVTDVVPAPNATHLLAHVQIPLHANVAEVMSKLDRATPRLRLEVARAITRKRAPELTFIPAPASKEVQP